MAETCDFLVIGSGVAGLTFALDAAEHGSVTIVTKRGIEESNTRYAQGGIAAVMGDNDSAADHIQDTIVAGAGLCHENVVAICANEGPLRVRELMDRGAEFDHAEGKVALTREGGHSARRVVHKADATGAEVERALVDRIRASKNIRVLEDHTAIDLITLSRFGGPERCGGVYVLDGAGKVTTLLARATILASGGAGKVYLYTTNPDVATGDGVAMAYRAGAEIADMEFYQFHPTALFHPTARRFLISEAVRGEGGVLRLLDGHAFMKDHDPRGDLAPRDVVARAIDFEMKRTGSEYVYLDITHKPASFIHEHFPTIHAECLAVGIDITRQPIPIVPAAHFMCGGITTDLHGRTTIPSLWAIGECASTGLHGANRLASNSLLEGLVFGHRAAVKLAGEIAELRQAPFTDVPDWEVGEAKPSDEGVVIAHNWDELRRTMWNYVGIVRSDTRLDRAARRIALLQDEIREYYWKHFVTRDLLELRNIATVAELIVRCAKARRESRGLHFTIDYPKTEERFANDTVVKRGVDAHLRGGAGMSEHDDEPASAGPRRPLPFNVFAAGAWSFVALVAQIFVVGLLLKVRPSAKDDLVSLFACQAVAYLFIVFAILRVHAPEASVRDFLAVRRTSWTFLPIGALFGVALLPVIDAAEELIERRWPSEPSGIVELYQGAHLSEKIMMGVVLIAIGPVLEEVLYRGALFQSVKKSPKVAVVVGTALFFAIAHPSWQAWAPLVVMGLLLGLLRAMSGSILPTIAFHATYNALVFSELVFPPADNRPIPWKLVGGGVALAVVLVIATVALGRRSRAAMIAQEMDKL